VRYTKFACDHVAGGTKEEAVEFIQGQAYAIYLAIASGACGIYLNDWRYWVINIPTIVLVAWKRAAK